MCTHNKDNEWYICLRNKDTVSQSLPQPGGMTQECALIIRIMNGTSAYVTRTPCHKACPKPGGMTPNQKHFHVFRQVSQGHNLCRISQINLPFLLSLFVKSNILNIVLIFHSFLPIVLTLSVPQTSKW